MKARADSREQLLLGSSLASRQEDTNKEIDECRRRAQTLLPKLPLLSQWASRQQKRYPAKGKAFILEFAGMPKAGKSSVIENLRHYFSHGPKLLGGDDCDSVPKDGYKVHTPAEGVSQRTPRQLKGNLAHYNTWAGAYALQELLQAQYDQVHDLVILDRGPWDAGCWLEYVRVHRPEDFEHTTEQEKNASVAFFQLQHWTTQADLHVVLIVNPAAAKERESRDRLIPHKGPASNEAMMKAMFEIYTARFKQLKEAKDAECERVAGASSKLLNTTNLHPLRVSVEVIESIFELLTRSLAGSAAKPAAKGVTETEIWEVIGPFANRYLRPEEAQKLRNSVGPLVEEINRTKAPSLLKDGLKEMILNEQEEGIVVLSARGEAGPVIQAIEGMIARAASS